LNERAAGVVGELVLSLVTASCGAWVGPDLGAGANGGTDAGRTAAVAAGSTTTTTTTGAGGAAVGSAPSVGSGVRTAAHGGMGVALLIIAVSTNRK